MYPGTLARAGVHAWPGSSETGRGTYFYAHAPVIRPADTRRLSWRLVMGALDVAWSPSALADRWATIFSDERPEFVALAVRARERHCERPDNGALRATLEAAPEWPWLVRALGARRTRPSFDRVPRELAPPPPWLGDVHRPRLLDDGELAQFLGIGVDELDRFCPRTEWRPRGEARVEHYHHRFVPKANGNRLLEIPKPRMKALQRRVLAGLLAPLPLHDACEGFVRGRSARTHAAHHTGRELVVRVDLADFFVSIARPRVRGFFATLGYPDGIARRLAALCTHAVPCSVLASAPGVPDAERSARWVTFAEPNLPQGAPTSPTLANLLAHRLDLRLTGLAERFGFVYSRYADDLTFSGSTMPAPTRARLLARIHAIVRDEGFAVNPAKTRAMGAHERQRVTGIVVNQRTTVPRREREALEAVLYNCVRHGPESQNRTGVADFRAYLAGRVGWVEHVDARHGAELRALFARIPWPPDSFVSGSGAER